MIERRDVGCEREGAKDRRQKSQKERGLDERSEGWPRSTATYGNESSVSSTQNKITSFYFQLLI